MTKKNSTAVDAHVGQRLRMFRLGRNITQETLATALGITFQQVQKYEKGSNRISASRLAGVASVLDVTIASLFEGLEVAERGPDPIVEMLSTSEGLSLARAFFTLTKAQRKALANLAGELVVSH